MSSEPNVYVLNGEDEFAIAQELARLQAGLGDPALLEMNTTRLDGNTLNPDSLLSVAGTLPFLAPRRLVILTNPLAKFKKTEDIEASDETPAERVAEKTSNPQEKFCGRLLDVPPTTVLILVIQGNLIPPNKKHHWLERFASQHTDRIVLKTFAQPKGQEMESRITALAKSAGGQIARSATAVLATYVDGDLRMADQEIKKLLAYVGYNRQITLEDVEAVTVNVNQGDIFALVDSLSARDGRKAFDMLHRMHEYHDYYELFGMISRQFRLLIQAREAIDLGLTKEEFQHKAKLHPYVAGKLLDQARRFPMPVLETAFRRLVDVDLAVKTSQAGEELALEYFAAAFTRAPNQRLIPTQAD